jgi:hypothetical protein
MTIWKQQRKRADISTLTSQHKPVNMSQTFICNEQELKCHRYLVFLRLFVHLFKEVSDTFHSDTVQCYVDTEDMLLSSLGR